VVEEHPSPAVRAATPARETQAPPVAVGPVIVASAPALHSIAAVDARTGVILRLLDTTTPVYAPVATDGAALYVASTGGVLTRYVP